MPKITLRHLATAVAALVAALYFLIALGALSVQDAGADPVIPTAAGVAFTILAVVLATFGNRAVWFLGAGMSLLTIIGYLVTAPGRSPAFELWGIVIKVAQAVLVADLGYLALRPAETGAGRRALS